MTLEPIPGVQTEIMNDNLSTWHAVIEGPTGSPYEGGRFNMNIEFPDNYPFKAPTVHPPFFFLLFFSCIDSFFVKLICVCVRKLDYV